MCVRESIFYGGAVCGRVFGIDMKVNNVIISIF